jgi:MFS family permease
MWREAGQNNGVDAALRSEGSAMKIFYGWIIVGVGLVVTCIGLGTMMSLGVFLQPMSLAMGWSRTGISIAALLNFLCMGVGSFLWGALSDRFGTRAVCCAEVSCSASAW